MDIPDLTSPENLLWLLLLPILYWLARPPRPRQAVATPHLAQWLRARDRLKRRPVRFRWLRFLLLLLAYAASVVALSGPSYGGRDGPTALAVVLDASASMGAVGAGDWASVRAELERELRALPEHVEARVAVCSDSVEVLTGDVDAILAALPATPTGAGGIDLAALAAGVGEPDRVVVWTITDGGMGVPESGALDLVGEPADNVALVALTLEDRWPLAEIVGRATVRSFAATAVETALIAEGGAEVDPIPFVLAAGATREVEVTLRRTTGGEVTLRLRGLDDALAIDDAVRFEVPEPPSVDIALMVDGEPPPQVVAAARALARETGGMVVDAAAGSHDGFVLVDGGIMPEGAKQLRGITFGTRERTDELTVEDLAFRPGLANWHRGHRLTSDLDLSELAVETALSSDFLGDDGDVLVTGRAGPASLPLVTIRQRTGSASVHCAFRLADSNLSLLPAFPQLLRRSFAAAFGVGAEAVLAPENLLDGDESDLRRRGRAAAEARPRPEYGRPGTSLVIPLLLLALGALAARVYA